MDLQKYGPWALVIGGSEGVGAAFARMLAADGFKLVLVARKPGPLEQLASELRGQGAEVRVLSADLSKSDVLDRVREVTDDIEVGLMIYNAGANNTRGLFVELPKEVTQSVLSITVLGQADFSRHYGALMALARESGMIIVAKGPDTLVAGPDGRLACARRASSWLSVAGTGDVLAGAIASRLAAGAEPFVAACEGVWLQGEAARLAGPAFTAGQLAAALPTALVDCL